MLTLILLLLDCGGLLLVFSHSPFFRVFGVLLHALSHGSLLCLLGLPFFGLLMLIVYVGGMLVVFLFSTVLSAERYPEFDLGVFFVFFFGGFILSLPLLGWVSGLGRGETFVGLVLTEGFVGQYGCFGYMTCVVGVILLMGLIVVLEFGFEHSRGALRKL